MRPGKSIGSLKGMLLFANIFGLIIAIVGAIAITYLMFIGTSAINATEFEYKEIVAAFYGLMIWLCATNIYYCLFIINFIRKTDDATFMNNRYVIALFSLSVGGFLTPYVLAQMPNIPVQSTLNPKVTISRGYAGNALISGTIALATYFITLSTLKQTANPDFAYITIVMGSVFGVIIFWGVLNTLLFSGQKAITAFEQKNGLYGLMNFVAILNLIWATIILSIQLIITILSMISLVGSLFDRRRGIFGSMLHATFVALKLAMYAFVLYTIKKTISGLWSPSNSFEYGQYTNLAEKQRQYEMQAR